MTPTEKYLKPHLIFGENTFDEYCSKIPDFYFKKEVPEDVIKNFVIVEKLLALSYYEYKFIDEAFAKAIHTFEMAMSIRYKDYFPKSKKIVFNTLINELTKLNLFDTNIEVLRHVKSLRNLYAHPERHSFGGIVIWNKIEFINRLINEMYEDVDLRLERQKLATDLIDKMRYSKLNNEVILEIQGKLTILFRLQLLFINNKQKPHSYLFACIPLFDLKRSEEGSIKVPFCFKSKLINLNFTEYGLTGTSFSANEKVTFSPIDQHEYLQAIFEKWNSEYQKIEDKFIFETSLNYYIPEILIPEIQNFQKM